MSRRRCALLFALLALAFPLAAQQVASDPPLQWQADVKANKRAQNTAEKAAEKALPSMNDGGREKASRPDGEGPPGGMGRPSDGGDGPPDGMGGPGGRGGPPDGGDGPAEQGRAARGTRNSAASMLRDEMDFAAPLKDTLILYRSREAVVFGREKSQEVVILPLSGDPVEFSPGERASLHEDPAGLRLEIATSNDIRVTYRYLAEPEGVLRVKIRAEGPVPRSGSHFEVERVYRLGASAK